MSRLVEHLEGRAHGGVVRVLGIVYQSAIRRRSLPVVYEQVVFAIVRVVLALRVIAPCCSLRLVCCFVLSD